MDCDAIKIRLGEFVDGEIEPHAADHVRMHLARCADCAAELDELSRIASELASDPDVSAPADLWSGIERALEARPGAAAAERTIPRTASMTLRSRRRFFAIAASLVALLGLGGVGLLLTSPRAVASAVDFSVLLDALPLDPHRAFQRFLVRYAARESTPLGARRHAPALNFDTPDVLPGGFHLERVYTLRFGNQPGVAATYRKNGEFLGVIFHPPVHFEDFGTHRDYECVVGKHRGHKVQVGEWKLVHLTDPTTCHCVLSRLDEHRELPQVMAAVAPEPGPQD